MQIKLVLPRIENNVFFRTSKAIVDVLTSTNQNRNENVIQFADDLQCLAIYMFYFTY